jgi:hypothetical protein
LIKLSTEISIFLEKRDAYEFHLFKAFGGLDLRLKWYSIYLTSTKPRVQTPLLEKKDLENTMKYGIHTVVNNTASSQTNTYHMGQLLSSRFCICIMEKTIVSTI